MPFMLRIALRDDGFGIAEVMVATLILTLGLSSLAYVATNTFSDLALTRTRVRANSLMDQAIEKVRALPYDTVKLGHRTSDLAAHVPEVTNSGGGAYRFEGERLPHGNGTPLVTPLNPLETSVEDRGVTYITRTYVTYADDDPLSGVLRITTLMTWQSSLRGGGERHTRSQTILNTPTGCSNTSTHTFSAPCQAFLTGSASVAHGQVSTSTLDGTFIGEQISRASMDLPDANSTVQLEQLAAVRSFAQRSKIAVITPTSEQIAGTGTAQSRADNDPASTGSSEWQEALVPTISSPGTVSKRLTGTDDDASNSIRMRLSANDTGRSRSTVAANATNVCPNLAETNQTDSRPCASARANQVGVMDVRLRLKSPTDYGKFFPMRIGPTSGTPLPENVRTFVKHYTEQTDGSQPCYHTPVNTNGCIHAGAERKLGKVVVGALPDQNLNAPTGWIRSIDSCVTSTSVCGDLLELSGYTVRVGAEAGLNAAAPSISNHAGTLRFWNGSGYTTMNVADPLNAGRILSCASGATSPCIPTVTINDNANNKTVRLTSSLRIGAVETPTDETCAVSSPCRRHGKAIVDSPILGTITYELCTGSTCENVTPDFTLVTDIDLGATTAEALYEDPPSA